MSFQKPRLAWLPITQLIMGCLFIGIGAVQAVGDYADQTVMQHRLSAHQIPPAAPAIPYTFPLGGRQLFPDYRLVALYGSPGAPVLGALGQQGIPASLARVKKLAASYQPYSKQPILPTFEIIASVASASPTANNDYSSETSPSLLQAWVTAARTQGVYVVLDLQPGRSNFLSQAKHLAPLLQQPNVGLALDPEWRLTKTQVPLKQIGSVSIGEVNTTANWLAALCRQHHLPQKLFLLHQFRTDMLPDRQKLDVSHPELAYAIQMDGQGTRGQKQNTWQAILQQPPAGMHFGWKNFYRKDTTLLSPQQTMKLIPQPWYVSYQ